MANEEKVIVTKSKITNLADKVRVKAGTSINYTFDSMAAAIENLQIGVDENSIYEELNSMEFGNTKFTITVKGVTGYYACSYMKYYLNGDSTTTYTVSTDTVTHNDVESITFYGTISENTWSSAFAAYITINGEDVGTETDIMASYSETFTITEDSDIIVTTSSLD